MNQLKFSNKDTVRFENEGIPFNKFILELLKKVAGSRGTYILQT